MLQSRKTKKKVIVLAGVLPETVELQPRPHAKPHAGRGHGEGWPGGGKGVNSGAGAYGGRPGSQALSLRPVGALFPARTARGEAGVDERLLVGMAQAFFCSAALTATRLLESPPASQFSPGPRTSTIASQVLHKWLMNVHPPALLLELSSPLPTGFY